MQRAFFRPDPSEPGGCVPPIYPDNVEGAIQHILAVLADIDCAYDEQRRAVRGRSGPRHKKVRWLSEIDVLHRQQREPYVKHLAELHRQAMSITLLRSRQ